MEKKYNVVVIGGGVAGTTVAYDAAANQQTVAVIENDLLGGTCPNRGCDPKKILYAGVESTTLVKDMQNNGITGEIKVDWANLMRNKRAYTTKVPSSTQASLEQVGVDIYHSMGQFNSHSQFVVDGDTLIGDKYVIATGQRPMIPNIEGSEHLLTSTDFLDLDSLPKDIVFIGGGYIGFELAAIANAAGAKVHLINHNDHPLKEYDSEYVKYLMDQLSSNGIDIILNTDVQKVDQISNDEYRLTGANFDLTTNAVFVTTGRIPNIENLGLENAKVDYDKKGIIVNEYLQTTNPHIYAAGDVVSAKIAKLTPIATFAGQYLAKLFNGYDQPIEYPIIPTILFSEPTLAEVGNVTEDDQYQVNELDMTNWLTYQRLHTKLARAKVVIDKDTQTIVGATILSDNADYLINILTILINNHETLADISKYIFTYPTYASDLKYLL